LLAIQVSSQLLLTARLSEGAEARVLPLPSGDKRTRPGTITLRDIEDVQTVQLCEVQPSKETSLEQKRADVKSEGTENRRKQWLSLFLRETLGVYDRRLSRYLTYALEVDLKYLTPYQVVEVPYEGRLRRFKVIAATSSSEKAVSSLAQGITQLSLSASDTARMLSVWAVGWDTVVTVGPSGKDHSEDAVSWLRLHKFQFNMALLPGTTSFRN
jgi:hypothetical protein